MPDDFVGELLGSRELADLASRIYRLGDALRAKLVTGPVKTTRQTPPQFSFLDGA